MKSVIEECIYRERKSCRGCEHSMNPELSDGGCRLLYVGRTADMANGRERSTETVHRCAGADQGN